MEAAQIHINALKSLFKIGEAVLIDGKQKALFVGFAENLKAELYFENGNVWDYDFSRIEKYAGDRFTKKLKMKFYGIKDFRYNFRDFL